MTTVDAEASPGPPPVGEPAVIARTLAYALSAVAASLWTADPDLWGHLRFGLDALSDRTLTSVDPYSFTSDLTWINHEWLSEVAMAVVYLTGGVPGMLVLKIALVGAIFGLLARHGRHAPAQGRWWVLAATAVLIIPVTVTMRPQLWTALFLALITTTTGWSVRRLLILWPSVFAIWANLHGGWIVGLGVVGAWIIGTALDMRSWRVGWRFAAVWSLCLAATLATPYGFELWRFIGATVGVKRHDISEWQPIWIDGPFLWLGGLVLVSILLRRASWSWAAVLPVVMLGVGSAQVSRLGGLWVIIAVALLLPRWRQCVPSTPFPRELVAVIVVASLLPAALLSAMQSRCLRSRGWPSPDVQGAGSLRGVTGRLMVPFAWGQFAIWHFGPGLKVSFDGRRETVYSPERIVEQHKLTGRDLSIVPFIYRERPEYVWVPRDNGDTLAGHLATAGYRADVTTEQSIILTRADLPALSPSPMSGCFP